ncbi:hypothetical protein A4D02_27630 [Niastella koreensis]|uniref:Nucleic acid binding OB-fold tRNA/helicase-type n=2 Tax=Niastella koreensis TaxID=354356 RepID=G8TI11_NIAKG|nr:hypothetical protein [Niastella koreensis]AEV99614.1 hypothetical protein Niako_3290 [Niastella koreensis GR20-10]OQP50202.1 hypothetical protein A4D02_27630 [Niastella koreensis]
MRTWKKIMIISIAMLIAAVSYGWYLYNKKPADTRTQTAAMETSAVELVKHFQQDEAAAGRQFVDKLIIVSGNISNTQIDPDGHATVLLDTGDPFAAVICSFYNDEVEGVKKIPAGSRVKIKGICTGILTDVILNKCTLLK